MKNTLFVFLILALLSAGGCQSTDESQAEDFDLRIATFNLEDVRTFDLKTADHPRLKVVAETIKEIRPDIVLINEIAFDQAGAGDFADGEAEGQNGQRLADKYLAGGENPLHYQAFSAPSNTGIHSGYDLNNDGTIAPEIPTMAEPNEDGSPARQTSTDRDYGNDTWGFGTFPGQYAMTVLINKEYKILTDQVRTFQHFLWKDMPNAMLPADPESGEMWYDEDEIAGFRLSSKSHWDIPVELPNGTVLHILASHPTPPAFDGAEGRNKRRNHDEIRFWADYINNADYIYDDNKQFGGLPAGASFVILGDLNADPEKGSSINNPIKNQLFANERINGEFTPVADSSFTDREPQITSSFGLRVDYVLPSTDLTVNDGAVWRSTDSHPSDHSPVWIDVTVPAPTADH